MRKRLHVTSIEVLIIQTATLSLKSVVVSEVYTCAVTSGEYPKSERQDTVTSLTVFGKYIVVYY